ncbi:MAG TPA: c-type cytochrome [Anaerolineae bacterium]
MVDRYLVFLGFVLTSWLVACQREAAAPATPAGPLANVPSLSELAGTPASTVPPLPTSDPDLVAQGQVIYAEHCASCHGVNLEGEPDWKMQNEDGSFRAPPHDASGHTWHHGDPTLIEAIELGGTRLPGSIGGTSSMPAFADVLTETEVTAVLTFIKSTWPDDIRALQWEQTAREQEQGEEN